MRRLLSVAVLSGLVALAPAVVAQHVGMGGHSGGFHGGFHGGFSGRAFAAPHAVGGFTARSFGGISGFAPRMNFRAVPRMTWSAPRYNMAAPGSRPIYAPAFRGQRGAWHRGAWRRDRHGYGYGGYYSSYPYYVNSWELLPWDLNGDDWSDDSSAQSSAGEQPESQPEYEAGPEYGAGQEYDGQGYDGLGNDGGYREDYAPPPPYESAATVARPAPVTPEPKLTLIFRDGHTQQIRNYMLTSDSLVDLDEAATGREPRIPLASLNLPATEAAARQAGLDFSLPVS